MKMLGDDIEQGVPCLEDIIPGLELYQVCVHKGPDFYSADTIKKFVVKRFPRVGDLGIHTVMVYESEGFTETLYLRDRGIFAKGQFKPYNYSRLFVSHELALAYYERILNAQIAVIHEAD